MTCVSELCANAITHTASGRGGVFTVEVDCPRDGVARVAVTDDGGSSVPAAGRLDLMAEGGRGLAMVAACTSRWGFREAYPGRTVWAEASWPVAVPSPRRERSAPGVRVPPVRGPAPGPARRGSITAGSTARAVNATDHQNVTWKECPARITASTAVPNDPPTCCMIRVTLLASGTDARGIPLDRAGHQGDVGRGQPGAADYQHDR